MTIDHIATDKLLTTTRSVRKRLDLTREVEPQVIADCIDIAMQAPTGTNAQNWAFVVITDPAKKKFIADAYRSGGEMMAGSGYPPPLEPGDPREHVMPKVMESAGYLGEILEQVPVFVIACVRGRVESVPMVIAQASTYGSILPRHGVSCWRCVRADSEPHGQRFIYSKNKGFQNYWGFLMIGLKPYCSPWPITRVMISSQHIVCRQTL